MGHVRQIPLPGAYAFHDGESLFQRHVGRVFFAAEAVEYQDIKSLKKSQRLFRDGLDIACVTDPLPSALKHVTVRLDAGMADRKRSNANSSDSERPVNYPSVGTNIALVCIVRRKCPRKHRPEHLHRLLRGIERQRRFMVPAEGSQIVKTGHMIQMAVRVNNGVDTSNVLAQSLLAQIGSRIHQEPRPVIIQQNGRTQVLIARIGRIANPALTPDQRHARRCSRTEK